MTHEHIDYKPIHATFLLLGLKQLKYPNVWSLSPLLEKTAWALNPTNESLIICEDISISFKDTKYYAENIDELYTALTDTVKSYTKENLLNEA